jgi:hypothetical protein
MVLSPIFASFAQKERAQPPSHQHDLAFTTVAVQADDRLEGLRRNVVGLAEDWDGGAVHMEVFGNALLV